MTRSYLPSTQNKGLYPKIKGLWAVMLGTLEVQAGKL